LSSPAGLGDVIRHHAERAPDAAALLAPNRAPMSFAAAPLNPANPHSESLRIYS
jgi:hypothetical protein